MSLDCAIYTPPINLINAKYHPTIHTLLSLRTHLNLWFIMMTFTAININLRNMGTAVGDTSLFSICIYIYFS